MTTPSIAVSNSNIVENRFLTRVVRLDAVASGGLGVLLLAAGWALKDPLGLPIALSAGAGAFLLAWAAALLLISRRPAINRTAVTEVIAINAIWVAASLALVVFLDLTGLGVAFVLAQAAAVGLFAELQLTALRSTR
ncbi:hypothetical protein [Kribbella swartbergensis]